MRWNMEKEMETGWTVEIVSINNGFLRKLGPQDYE